jgi:hypothetical protein
VLNGDPLQNVIVRIAQRLCRQKAACNGYFCMASVQQRLAATYQRSARPYQHRQCDQDIALTAHFWPNAPRKKPQGRAAGRPRISGDKNHR